MSLRAAGRRWAKQQLQPYAKLVASLPSNARVVDIGCGNHSPSDHKRLREDIHYTGVDIQRYALDAGDDRAADRIVILARETYDRDLIAQLGEGCADLVTMKHVIEHLDAPLDTLRTCVRLLAPGGRIYLAFPSERSATAPSADGTLNFHDDATHVWLPDVDQIAGVLTACGLTIETQIRAWSHPLLSAVGAIEYGAQRARQAIRGGRLRSSPFLWSLFGFEAIVIARR
jgi:SAM-dependent methyltransferase